MNNQQIASISPWAVFGIASLATFLISIDSTILYAAFNSIATSFPKATPASISWVMNAYTIVYATTLIPAGGIADRLGRKTVFMYGVGIFVSASFLCGVAPNTEDGKSSQLMSTIDAINTKYSRGAIRLASEGVEKAWVMRRSFKSPNYTGEWRELPKVK